MLTAISDIRHITRVLKFIVAFWTNIEISYEFRFISIVPRNDLLLTFVAIYNIFPSTFDVILTKLISQWNPSRSQIIISREQFNFLCSGHKHFD